MYSAIPNHRVLLHRLGYQLTGWSRRNHCHQQHGHTTGARIGLHLVLGLSLNNDQLHGLPFRRVHGFHVRNWNGLFDLFPLKYVDAVVIHINLNNAITSTIKNCTRVLNRNPGPEDAFG